MVTDSVVPAGVKQLQLVIVTGFEHPSINLALAFNSLGYNVVCHQTISEYRLNKQLPEADVFLVHIPTEVKESSEQYKQEFSVSGKPIVITHSEKLIGGHLQQWVFETHRSLIIAYRVMAQKRQQVESRQASERIVESKFPRKASSADKVWVLGASFGGPDAISRFLQYLPSVSGLALIVAQHIGVGFSRILRDQLCRHTGYEVLVPETIHRIKEGQVIVLPSNKTISYASTNELCLHEASTESKYTPNISDVIAETASVFREKCGVILFSGMGDDGASACEIAVTHGSNVWVQTPADCISSSMPERAISTGFVEMQGTPEELAKTLVDLLADDNQEHSSDHKHSLASEAKLLEIEPRTEQGGSQTGFSI